MFDSELKFVFNFLKNHAHKGNKFVIEIKSLIKVCGSCSRELLMLEELMNRQKKKVVFVVKHNKEIEGFIELLNELK